MFAISVLSADISHSVDHTLSRIDYALLNDQARMEIVIEGLNDASKALYQDDNSSYLDACDWEGIKCGHHVGEVSDITFDEKIEGTLLLSYTPPKVKNLNVRSEKAQGTLDTSKLPEDLETLSIIRTAMHGSVDFTKIPEKVTGFTLKRSLFSGSCDFTALPPCLVCFYIMHNEFEGPVDLIQLPKTVRWFSIGWNNFSGSIDLESLPERLETLYIHENKLCGKFQFLNVPHNLTSLWAYNNAFDAAAKVSSRVFTEDIYLNVYLSEAGVSSVVDENGQPHHAADRILYGEKPVIYGGSDDEW